MSVLGYQIVHILRNKNGLNVRMVGEEGVFAMGRGKKKTSFNFPILVLVWAHINRQFLYNEE